MDLNGESDILITKLILNDQTIYLKIMWTRNETDVFQLKVFEGDRTWSGQFTTECANKYREYFDETKLQYLNSVKQSLSGNCDEFTHSLNINTDEPNTATFVWKKKFIGSTATRIHGSVSLQLDATPESKENLIDHLLNENKRLHHATANINEKINLLTGELDRCKQEMENFVDIKTSLESALYGKFVQVLNTKKRRIQVLEENIQKITQGKM